MNISSEERKALLKIIAYITGSIDWLSSDAQEIQRVKELIGTLHHRLQKMYLMLPEVTRITQREWISLMECMIITHHYLQAAYHKEQVSLDLMEDWLHAIAVFTRDHPESSFYLRQL